VLNAFIHFRVISNGARNKKHELLPLSASSRSLPLLLFLSVSVFSPSGRGSGSGNTMCTKHRMRRRSVIGWQAIIQAWPKGKPKSQQMQLKSKRHTANSKAKSKVIQKSKQKQRKRTGKCITHFFKSGRRE